MSCQRQTGSTQGIPHPSRGQWPKGQPRVAIIGSRRATADQLAMAQQLAAGVAKLGGVVVSGGALGVDAAALRGALAAGGRGVAILPRAPDRPYPPGHAPLFDELVASGGLVLGLGGIPEPLPRWAFARRNGLLVASVDAIVAVAAATPSGTLQAAASALRMGRPLAVVGWPGEDAGTAGTRLLSQLGVATVYGPDSLGTWLDVAGSPPHAAQLAGSRQLLRRLLAATRGLPQHLPAAPWRTANGGQVDGGPPPRPSYVRDDDPPAVAAVLQTLQRVGRSGLTLEALLDASESPRAEGAASVLTLVLRGDVVQRDDGTYVAVG